MPDGLAGNSPFEQELRAIELAQGGLGYVELLAVSPDRRAILLERLGRPLSALGLSAERQIEVITATVSQGWRSAPDGLVMRDGATQARWLAEFIVTTWEELSRPCPEALVDLARQFAAHRASSVRAHPVVIHGDAHPDNVLEDPDRPGLFKLIDPDAMVSDPAHELGIVLRDWSEELLARDPLTTGQAWCRATAAEIGALSQAVWEWAYLERMSTGLFMAQLGLGRGRSLLEVAARWAEAPRITPSAP
jgi:streptomycin 6-kinase